MKALVYDAPAMSAFAQPSCQTTILDLVQRETAAPADEVADAPIAPPLKRARTGAAAGKRARHMLDTEQFTIIM